ncbi:CRISPR locus-related DNA-binding protein [Candidatus Dojkabacteria bacterium]|nr:CRISPR locus-related DNA-binding protein [Candidatus Dojkabacteria bacterium]
MATLIAPFYEFDPFFAAAHAHRPTKIVLLVSDSNIDKKDEKYLASLEKVEGTYGKLMPIEIERMDCSNLLSMAKKAVGILEREKKSIAYIGGGPRIMAVALLHACYARKDFVERIICLNVIDKLIVELPKLTYGLSSAKKELLQEISERNGKTISDIAKNLNKSKGMIYQHLKELKEEGYVNETFSITDAGRMALL